MTGGRPEAAGDPRFPRPEPDGAAPTFLNDGRDPGVSRRAAPTAGRRRDRDRPWRLCHWRRESQGRVIGRRGHVIRQTGSG